MMQLAQLSRSFHDAGLGLPPLPGEDEVIEHAFEIHDFFRLYLTNHNYPSALAGLELLMRKKVREPQDAMRGIRVRRDGRTPDFLHELRIGLSVIADHVEGMIPERYMEPLLTLAFTHDMGEDFNIFADSYAKFMDKTTKSLAPELRAESRMMRPDIEYLALGMERLTFDRKFSAAQIAQELRITKKNFEVGPEHLGQLIDKIESNSMTVNGYLPAMSYIPEPDAGGRYIFSRYIRDGIIDWIEYANGFSHDPNTGLVKEKDRNDGLGTRIGPNFDIEKYSHYLSKSFHIFSTEKMGERMAARFPDLRESFAATDKMLGALHRIGRTYVEVHPLKNPAGTKGFQIENLSDCMDFRDYFPGALCGYRRMAPGTMPLNIILARIQADRRLNGQGQVLHDKFVNSIAHNIEANSPAWLNNVNQLEMGF